jgi:CRP-like cAMP-binding protein
MTNPAPELLHGLTDAETARITAKGTLRRLSAGDVLFNLGDEARSVYIVRRGRVALSLPMQVRGRDEDILIEERFAGQTVGWSALTPPYHFTLKARTLVESELLVLPRADLLDTFAADPRVGQIVARNLAAVIGQRLHVFQAMWLREMQRVVDLRHA